MALLFVVDDDVDAADILADLLRSEGHDVESAYSGREGLALVHRAARHPDLVILDVEMPQLTGPEMVYQMLVHDLGEEEIPILLCSGVLDLAGTAAVVGTPYFLPKPYALDDMLRLVGLALAERRPPLPRDRR